MGLKEPGLRGSLRNVSVGIDAIPDSVVDDFETGDISRYSGDAESFAADDDSFIGDFALEFEADKDNNAILSDEPVDGFIPTVGRRFSFYARDESDGADSAGPTLLFCIDDGDIDNFSGYGVTWFGNESGPRIVKFDSGKTSDSELEQGNGAETDDWVEVEIEVHGENDPEPEGTIKVTSYLIDQNDGSRQSEDELISVIDSDFIDQDMKFGWWHRTNGTVTKTRVDDSIILDSL